MIIRTRKRRGSALFDFFFVKLQWFRTVRKAYPRRWAGAVANKDSLWLYLIQDSVHIQAPFFQCIILYLPPAAISLALMPQGQILLAGDRHPSHTTIQEDGTTL